MSTAASQHVEFPALRDSRYPVHRIAARIGPCQHEIVERIRPKKIILFGSQAYGQPDEHSDVDLLVVRKGIESEMDSNREIRRATRESRKLARLPFTFLSKTPERIAEQLGKGSPLYEKIVGQGVVLYAASEN